MTDFVNIQKNRSFNYEKAVPTFKLVRPLNVSTNRQGVTYVFQTLRIDDDFLVAVFNVSGNKRTQTEFLATAIT